jgi:protein ImuB
MILPGAGGLAVTAVDDRAAAEGLRPGMALAHACALVPALRTAPADPEGDAAALGRLALWASRYTPWVATDGDDGLVLDISGCAHLFGGEAALLRDMVRRLRCFGLAARAACADTPAAAWAWARHGSGTPVLDPGATRAAAGPLPTASLRIPAATVAALERLGLRTLADLFGLPRAPLARRFGADLPRRLDQFLGHAPEPISPVLPPPVWQTRLQFPEPIVHRDGVDIALDRLLRRLCALLAEADQGARELGFTLGRVDCTAQHVTVGTSRPVRDPLHLKRLFLEKLDRIDAGFGIETAVLAATRVEAFTPIQGDLGGGADALDAGAAERVWALVDRLQNRFGADQVRQVAAVQSHLPERAVAAVPVRRLTSAPGPAWPQQARRPLTLLPAPEPILALAPVPDDPPLSFTWRRVVHRIAHAEGPERIDPEWWRQAQPLPDRRRCRDYYRVEDADGRRFWIFREGLYGLDATPRWFMHGVFP